ncbi:MAG: GIN domain-containing protein [Candidatus Cryptobacteroides sp.]
MMEDKIMMCVIMALLAFMPQSCMIRVSTFANHEGVVVGSGKLTEIKIEDPEEFDEFTLSIPMDIEYSYGEPSVVITCDENAAKYIDVKQSGNSLEIAMTKEKATLTRCSVTARISSHSLKSVTIAGGGSFEAKGIDEKEFVATIAGSGDIDISGLKTGSLKLVIAGSGDIDLEGVDAIEVNGSIAGSGDIGIEGKAEKATFSIAGSGKVESDHLECPMKEFK